MVMTLLTATCLLGVTCTSARAGTVTYIVTDPRGTPLVEADSSGVVIATYDYKPYGAQVLGSTVNGPGYTGHVNDADVGLIYMQARYYDPLLARFISEDPVRATGGNLFDINEFDYARDNAENNVDPDGRMSEDLRAIGPNDIRMNVFSGVSGGMSSHECDFCLAKKKGRSKPKQKPSHERRLTYEQMVALVSNNNKSDQPLEVIISMAWTESSFDPSAKSSSSTATGLLGVTAGAARAAGANPKDMTDPAKNIAAGSAYLQMRINWAHGDISKGLDGYGTGPGYSGPILNAANQLQEHPENHTEILEEIHP
jgi:RHS repeat-associated protein